MKFFSREPKLKDEFLPYSKYLKRRKKGKESDHYNGSFLFFFRHSLKMEINTDSRIKF